MKTNWVRLDYRHFSPGLKDTDNNCAFPIIIIWNLHVLGDTRHFAKKSTCKCGAILIKYCISQFWKTENSGKNTSKFYLKISGSKDNNLTAFKANKKINTTAYLHRHRHRNTLFFIHPKCLFISQKTASTKTKIDLNNILVTKRTKTFYSLCLFLSRKTACTHVKIMHRHYENIFRQYRQ